MFATRPSRLGATLYPSSSLKHYVCSPAIACQPLPCRSKQLSAVIVFSKKGHRDHININDDLQPFARSAELQTYIERERFLLAELTATRCQVDKLLDQQQQLLAIIVRLSGWSDVTHSSPSLSSLSSAPSLSSSSTPNAIGWSPTTQPPAPAPPRITNTNTTTTAPATSRRISNATTSSSSSSSSSHVPAPSSLTELFRSAADTATHPATAAAAASVAAAIAAVDTGDILAIRNVLPEKKISSSSTSTTMEPQEASSPTSSSSSALPSPPASVFDMLSGFTTSTSAEHPGVVATAAAGAADGATAVEAPSELLVEVAKASPTGAPPDLVLGDDDIFWMSKLHAALEQRGFYPGDDDLENWFFGESTQAAVFTFQASERLPETGVVDQATWTELLGQEVAQELYGRADSTAAPVPAAAAVLGSPGEAAAAAGAAPQATPGTSGAEALDRWPVLMEGDGGRKVHALQVALTNQGYYCGEDDMRWWQFGDSTLTALKVFQSSSGVPESGVAEERTWRALLGSSASPAQIYSLKMDAASDGEDGGFEQDMDGVSKGQVWLLGEQRWEKRG